MKSRAAAVLLLFPAAALAGDVKPPKCFSASREGHCIEVQVNGQPNRKLSKQTKKMLERLGGLRFGGDETRYEVTSPVRGALDVRARFVAGAAEYFGPSELAVHVMPLEEQSLDTRRELSTASNVRAAGGAVVTQSDVLRDSRLPPGKYLLSVSLSGPGNWDRQTLYFQVVE